MAKKSNSPSETQTLKTEAAPEPASQAAEPTQAPPTTPESAPPSDAALAEQEQPQTGLAVAASTELATVDDGVTMQHLIPLLPHKKNKLKRVFKPTDEQFETALSEIDAPSRHAFEEMLARLSPEKEGIEDDTKSFRPFIIKLRQGMSNDENCPELIDVGGLYTSDGRILTGPTEAKARKNGVGTKVKAVILNAYKGRVFFTPRVNGRLVALHEFGDANINLPLCQSMDRAVAAPVKYAVPGIGTCKSCPYEPWKVRGEQGLCNNSVVLDVVLYREENGELIGFDGLYELSLTKTSEPTGNWIMEQAAKWKSGHEHVIELFATEKEGKDGNPPYFIVDATVATDQKTGRPLKTPETHAKLISLLWNKLMCEYYFPRLAWIYAAHKRHLEGGGSAPSSNEQDMSALERKAAARSGGTVTAPNMREENV